MVDKGEGYSAYQDLKDNSFYHGYQPLKPRKTPKFSAEFGLGSGMLNMFVLFLFFEMFSNKKYGKIS